MATLRKIKNLYYIRIWINGREKCFSTGTSIHADAKRQLKKFHSMETEIKQKVRNDWDNPSLDISKAIKMFLAEVKIERNLRDKTMDIYKTALKNFQDCFKGYEKFEDFSKTDISVLVRYLKHRYGDTSLNMYLRNIRSFFNYLYEKELIPELPFKIKQIRIDSEKPKFITPEDLEKIYSNIHNPKMLSTLKVYEVTGLRLRELHNSIRDGKYIKVVKSKGRKERIIPIPENYINDYDIATNHPYRGSSISQAFRRACAKVGIRRSIHSMRHTYAIRKLIETNNIVFVKELLGHRSVQTTEIYLKFPREYLMDIFQPKPEIEEPIGQITCLPN